VLFGLHGGVVADRMNKRNVLLLWQSVAGLTSGATAVAVASGHIQVWMLLANGFVTGIAFAFIGPARQAFTGDLVPPHLLGNAIVLQQANANGTRVFGPALAGALIAVPLVGMTGVFVITTAGFLIATAAMVRLPPGAPSQHAAGRSALQDIHAGLSYVRRDRVVGLLVATGFLVVVFAFPYQGFLASMTREAFHRGTVALGVLSSLAALGALGATLVVATLTGHRHAWRIQTAAGAGFGLALIGFGYAPSFGAGLLLIFLVGALAGGFQALNSALAISLAEPRYHGRVQALMGMSWSLLGLVSLALGVAADSIGIRAALAFTGAAAVVGIVAVQIAASRVGAEAEVQRRRTAHHITPEARPSPAALPREDALPVETPQSSRA
jgi:MFS family permease